MEKTKNSALNLPEDRPWTIRLHESVNRDNIIMHVYGRVISETEYIKHKDVLGQDWCWRVWNGKYVKYLVVDRDCLANFINAKEYTEDNDTNKRKYTSVTQSSVIANCYASQNKDIDIHDDECVEIRAKHDIHVEEGKSVELILTSYHTCNTFQCPICNVLFVNPNSLKRHQKINCKVIKRYTCKHCGGVFVENSECVKHMKMCSEYENGARDGDMSYLLNRIPLNIKPLDLPWFSKLWEQLAHPVHVVSSYNSRSIANSLMDELNKFIGGSYILTKLSACSVAQCLPSVGLYSQRYMQSEVIDIAIPRVDLPLRVWYLHGMYLGDFGRPGDYGANVSLLDFVLI